MMHAAIAELAALDLVSAGMQPSPPQTRRTMTIGTEVHLRRRVVSYWRGSIEDGVYSQEDLTASESANDEERTDDTNNLDDIDDDGDEEGRSEVERREEDCGVSARAKELVSRRERIRRRENRSRRSELIRLLARIRLTHEKMN
jgi:hypothetical protein